MREKLRFYDDWKFFLGDPHVAGSPGFDAAGWRAVDLPHDWSIEGKMDPQNPAGGSGGSSRAASDGTGEPSQCRRQGPGRRVTVGLEGVYMNATVYIKGDDLGTHAYGYTTFFHDLTPHLQAGPNNVLAVRVDQSKHRNSRWYAGSGIYRHVWLHATDPVQIDPWGTFVTTPEVSEARAKVLVSAKIDNESGKEGSVAVETVIYGASGTAVGRASLIVPAHVGQASVAHLDINVDPPALWSPDTPNLYRAVTRVTQGGKALDEASTTFGIRSIECSADRGFLLNGKPLKMCGGCVHHDQGSLGAISTPWCFATAIILPS